MEVYYDPKFDDLRVVFWEYGYWRMVECLREQGFSRMTFTPEQQGWIYVGEFI